MKNQMNDFTKYFSIFIVLCGVVFGYGSLNTKVSAVSDQIMPKQEIISNFQNKQIQIDILNTNIKEIKDYLKDIKIILVKSIKDNS